MFATTSSPMVANVRSLLAALFSAASLISPHFLQGQSGYFPEFTNAAIASRSINVSLPVGATPGSAAVSAVGGASYSIPIQVPPGSNGMRPDLGLVYNSHAGDGLLGVGWSLSGTSMIHRVGRDNFRDGETHPIRYTNDDRYALDGKRLVPMGSPAVYHAIGAKYDTEDGALMEVSAIGSIGVGPAGFKAIQVEGITIYYGQVDAQSADAVVMRSTGGQVLAWMMSKVVDPYGNTTRYHYSNNDLSEAKRLVSIEYSANEALSIAPYNSIEFNYFSRNDVNHQFVSGSEIRHTFLLDRVDIRAEGALYKRYSLNYAHRQLNFANSSNGVSFLREVTESDGNGNALNSTQLKYEDLLAAQVMTTNTFTGTVGQVADIYSADFDGNGKGDLLVADAYYSDGMRVHSGFRVFMNESNTSTYTHTFPIGDLHQIVAQKGGRQFLTGDYDGDGRADIMVARIIKPGTPGDKYKLTGLSYFRSTSVPNDAEFLIESIGTPNGTYVWLWPGSPKSFIYPGDFDGDGRAELMIRLMDSAWNTSQFHRWRHTGSSSWGWVQQSVTDANHFATAGEVDVLDANGDGRHELLSRNDGFANKAIVLSMNTMNTWQTIISAGTPTSNDDVMIGDFNGDGASDLLYRTVGQWRVRMSKGTTFSEPYLISMVDNSSELVRIGDFDGDGRTDILRGHYAGTQGYKWTIAYSLGLRPTGPAFDYRTYSSANSITSLTLADLDGDGKTEVLNRHYYLSPVDVVRFNARSHERRLDKVSDGLLNITDFDHAYLSDSHVYSEVSQIHLYPGQDMDGPLPVVYTVARSNGIGGMRMELHGYKDGYGWRNGPGFLGFLEHTVADVVSQTTVVNKYNLVSTSLPIFHITESKILKGASNTPVRQVNYWWYAMELPTTGSTRHKLVLNDLFDKDMLSGITTQTTTIHNLWGKPSTSTRTVGSSLETTVTTVPSYTSAGPSTFPVKPNSVQVTTTRSGAPSQTVNTTFTYDPVTGGVSKKIEFQNKAIKLTTDYLYWAAGPLKQSTLSYTGLASNDHRVESWTYESRYRFPNTATTRWNNSGTLVNVTETFTYDPKWGTLLTHLSTDQLRTDHVYDAFGRQTSVTAPYIPGTPRYSITNQLVWNVTGTKRYYLQTTDPGGPDAKVWYDHLGREVERQSASFASGSWATSNIMYDAAGRVGTITLPRLSGETPQTITHAYDELGRPASAVNSFSGTTSYSYSYSAGKLTTTVTDPASRSRSTTTDATGQVSSASDEGGTLTYAYDSWGNLLNVKRGVQTLVANTYDTYGRQTKLVDSDAGTTEYLYNAFHLLTWQKNPHGQVSAMSYDNLGRLKQRDDPEGTSNWTYYYVGGKFNNNVTSATGLGTTYTYTYDAFGRRTNEVRTSPSGNMGKQFGYDDYDRLANATYANQPLQVALTYTYTGTGHLDKVQQLNGPVLFQGLTMNGFGRYRTYSLADGKTTTVTYAQQYPTRIQASGVQDLRMAYDYQTGNLTHRWDYPKNRKDSFTYDGLDRLIQAKTDEVNLLGSPIYNVATLNYGFDGSVGGTTRGNLVARTDIGAYGYNGNRIAAAYGPLYPTPPDNPPLAISQATQTVTYSSFHQPLTVQESVASNPFTLAYTYGPDHQRTNSQLTAPGGGGYYETRQYFGELERQEFEGGDHNWILYVQGGDGLCAMIVLESHSGQTTYSVYKDHLGSIVALTKKVGSTVTVEAQQNFDAWGRRRNPNNWTYTGIPAVPQWLYRGYTGHEHVEPFALINMNGRMYDPLNGRMLSADNYVNGMFSTQAYNRFSYANNNPLKYTDPDGEIAFLAVVGIVAAVSGGLNLAANWGNVNSFGDGLFYFGVGAGIGAGATVGGAALAPVIGTGAISGAVFGAAGGFLGGFSNTMFSTGGDWNSAFNVGATGALYGGVGGALLAGAWAGFSGKNVWTGASPGGQSVFSFGGGENGPTFRLVDAYSIGRKDFWQYGRNLKPVVEPGKPTPSINEHAKEINYGQQGKHVPDQYRTGGQNYRGTRYIDGRSTIEVNPEQILSDIHSGNYEFIQQTGRGPVIKMNYNVGTVINENSGSVVGRTSYVKIHGNPATGSVHFVPWLPLP